MEYLTGKEEDFCETTGLFGILLSAACLIQLFFYFDPYWITFVITALYLLAAVNFILILKKSSLAFLFLIISSALVFLLEVVLVVAQIFSTLLILLLIYMIVVLCLAYMSELPTRLKQKSIAEKAEKEKWEGII